MSSQWKLLWRILSAAVTGLVVLLAVLLVGVRLLGLTPYTVLSGSMEPVYPTGSLLYVKKSNSAAVKVGDAITFVLNEDLVIATHRVVEIDTTNTCFYTKGDANEHRDSAPVDFRNLIGKPQFCIPLLGYVAHFLSAPLGQTVAVASAALLLLLSFLPSLITALHGKRSKSTQALDMEPPPSVEPG